VSTHSHLYIVHGLMCRREVHEEITGGERDRDRSPKTGSIDARRGSDDCCTDAGCGSWSCGQYQGSDGRCVMLA